MTADDVPEWTPTRWKWEIRDAAGELVRPVDTLLDWQGRDATVVAADLVALLLHRTEPARLHLLAGWSVRVSGDAGEYVELLDDWPIPEQAPVQRRPRRRRAA